MAAELRMVKMWAASVPGLSSPVLAIGRQVSAEAAPGDSIFPLAVITGAEIMSLRPPTLFFLFILPSLEVGFDNEYWKKLGVLFWKRT